MDTEKSYLTRLLGCALSGETPPPPGKADIDTVMRIARRNRVSALAAHALLRLPPEALESAPRAMLEAECARAQRAEAVRFFTVSRALKALSDAGIDCCPLKGWAMQALYPAPYLREMNDVDVLVREKDRPRAGEILQKAGFRPDFSNGNHDVYLSDAGVCVEAHGRLIDPLDKNAWYASNAWALPARGADGAWALMPTERMLYALTHDDKHMFTTGIGARAVIDLYLMRRAGGVDWPRARDTLARMGLLQLEESLSALGEGWLEGAELSPEMDAAGAYLMEIGCEGRYSPASFAALRSRARGTGRLRARYLLSEFFPARRRMALDYPILTRHGALLPLYWAFRLIRIALFSRGDIARGARDMLSLSGREGKAFASYVSALYKKGE